MLNLSQNIFKDEIHNLIPKTPLLLRFDCLKTGHLIPGIWSNEIHLNQIKPNMCYASNTIYK